jgi:HopJ type III effector protein
MNITSFLHRLKQSPETILFTETIAIIAANYNFTPTAFQNGLQYNAAGENSGSCQLFAFAKLQKLTEIETLTCFGAYYFKDVLEHPTENNHQNIRNFMKTGWNGIQFESEALALK